jgi:hypothetical protein
MTYVQPIGIRGDLVACKKETTYGTDITPGPTTDAVRINKRAWNSIAHDFEWANLRDEAANNSFVPIQAAAARGMKARLTLGWELKGLGATYTSSSVYTDADPLFQACGWAGVYSANTWTYAPITTPTTLRPSATVYVWTGGKQYKVTGARGNFEAIIRAGQIINVTFTLEGFLAALETDVAVPASTYSVAIPPAAVSQSCSIGGGVWTPDYDEITIRSGNEVGWLYSGNAADGLQSFDYGISRPEIVVKARSVPTATYSPWGDQQAGTARAFTLSWGTVAYNKGVFSDTGIWIPRGGILEPQGPGGGFTGWQITYRCLAPQLLLN